MRSTRANRIAAIGLAACLAFGATGCDLLKVGYRNSDTVGVFLIDRYLDLSGDQKEFVKPRLRSLLAWHRSTQLPDYVALATELQRKAQLQITSTEVAALSEQSRRKALATVDHAVPDMADLALRLTPANVKALEEKFSDDDDKWVDANLKGDLEKRQKERFEKTLERVEEWYGKFSRDQRAAIRRLSDARPLDNDVLHAERQRRQQELLALLTRVVREKPPRDTVIAMMKAYADRFDPSPDPQHRAFIDSLHAASNEMNAQIHNQATPQQRRRAVAKLQGWIDDFRSLASEGE